MVADSTPEKPLPAEAAQQSQSSNATGSCNTLLFVMLFINKLASGPRFPSVTTVVTLMVIGLFNATVVIAIYRHLRQNGLAGARWYTIPLFVLAVVASMFGIVALGTDIAVLTS